MDLYLDKNLILASNVKFEDAKVALFGAPFDSTSTYRSGSRQAPYTIRREFLELEKDVEGSNFFDIPFHDAGNFEVVHGDISQTFKRISSTLAKSRESNPKFIPFLIGGEHTLTFPFVEFLAAESDLTVVSLDAHLDFKSEYNGSEWNHSTVMYQISKLDVPVIEAGVRSFDEQEAKNLTNANASFFGKEFKLNELIKEISKKDVYLSVDMDVLDPGQAPGVGNPQPDGFSLNKLKDIIYSVISEANLVGFDLMEVCPAHDHGSATSVAGAKILLDALIHQSKKTKK
ncbi:MAG: agmatinase [Candidatus Altiarchaeota archaeon]